MVAEVVGIGLAAAGTWIAVRGHLVVGVCLVYLGVQLAAYGSPVA